MTAGLLNWPQCTFASKFELQADGKEAKCEREIDGGLETVKVKLPLVLTADLRLNTPRYATLPNIMKAKKKPLAKFTPKDLDVDITPRQTIVKVAEPPKRQGGGKVKDVEELVQRIKKLGVF
jgi:electron transfer flavoprotein beta subunit